MKQTWYTRKTCRLCNAPVKRQLALQPSALANNYTEHPIEQTHYPLDLMQCTACGHVQLGIVVDPAVLYADYRYQSGTSTVFTNHLKFLAQEISTMRRGGLVVEIGSNDGTLLKAFEALGHRILGVDPAGSYRNIQQCFVPGMVPEIIDSYGKAQVIAAVNVLAHIDDLHSTFTGIKQLLAFDGVFVMEVQYLSDLLSGNRFDMIYHEHLDYHHLAPLKACLEREGFHIFNARQVDTQGGSLRLYCHHLSAPESAPREVADILRTEQIQLGKLTIPPNPVAGLDGVVAAYGACAKTTGLICQTGAHFDVLFDDTPSKHGMYAPTGQKIVTPGEIEVDHVYIAAWNFEDEIRARHPELPYVGTVGRGASGKKVHENVREARLTA